MKKTIAATLTLFALAACGSSYDTSNFEKELKSSGANGDQIDCVVDAIKETDELSDGEKKRLFTAKDTSIDAMQSLTTKAAEIAGSICADELADD